MTTHKYFLEAVGGFLIHKKGQQLEEYMDYIVQLQVPIDEIAIVLLSRMWKIHVCVFLEGKYWTTNKDETLNKATMYLVYLGKNVYHDTTRKGSLHWSVMEASKRSYNLRKPQPKLPGNFPDAEIPPSGGHKTLNSLQAGLINDKAKRAAQREYNKLHPTSPKPSGHQKPEKEKKPKGKLQVQQHGIPRRHPKMKQLKCPVCKDIFSLIKNLNTHVRSKHKRFRYKCQHCIQKYQNYASCYKHQNMLLNAPHVCKICQKGFWFPKNLIVHEHTHTHTGLFWCTNCSNMYTTQAAMDTHRVTHQGHKLSCAKCSFFQPILRQICDNIIGANMERDGVLHVANIMTGWPKCFIIKRSVKLVKKH